MLGSLAQEQLQELAQDEAFLAHLDSVVAGLRDYVASPRTWYQKQYGRRRVRSSRISRWSSA